MNRDDIVQAVGKRFESSTLQPTTGYFKRQPENSSVVEIVEAREDEIEAVARDIRAIKKQATVLVMSLSGKARKIAS